VIRPNDGPGAYGGTQTVFNVKPDHSLANLGRSTLLRWSPMGEPLVPGLARTWSVSADATVLTFILRRGLRWSDGQPMTTADIRYAWEQEVLSEVVGKVPEPLRVRGQPVRMEFEPDNLTFRIVLPFPDSTFIYGLLGYAGHILLNSPAHYLRRYHPQAGDQVLIARELKARGLSRPQDLYLRLKRPDNPEHPRLWPFLYRQHQATAPYVYVRNPWFWMVDESGNQLPYLDRIQSLETNPQLLAARLCAGEIETGSVKGDQFGLLQASAERGDYDVHRWMRGDRSDALVHVNQNRRVDPDDPVSALKARFLAIKEFRQALSLAVDRREIIEANYLGETLPAQVSPGPQSYFSHPRSFAAFTEHDPERANRLLDGIGLTGRDHEGMRTFPDGTRMQFFLDYPTWFKHSTAQYLSSHWAAVGLRVTPRQRQNSLFYTEKQSFQHDLTCFTGTCEHLPLFGPGCFLPVGMESNFGLGWTRWYQDGGMHGDPKAERNGGIAPPAGHPIREALALWERLKATTDRNEQKRLMDGILDIAAEQVWTIGICTSPDYAVMVRRDFRGVPHQVMAGSGPLGDPWGEQTSFKVPPSLDTAALADLRRQIATVIPDPRTASGAAIQAEGGWLGTLLAWAFGLIVLAGLALVCLRHPFVLRRLLIMIPTLSIISLVVFAMIQAPPGDFISAKIVELQSQGERADPQELENLRRQFHLDESLPMRYLRWSGLRWFVTWQAEDRGLLQGDLGRSMEHSDSVNRLLGDRILLTALLSLGTILFTWLVAIPVGVYSAVRQYSFGDHLLTGLVFLGNCIPSFLLALVLVVVSLTCTGTAVGGLFSPQYATVAGWNWGKFLDLMAHLWLPVVVLGVTGTAGLIRVMRANLLDELKKPYVTTARAKGVRPMKLLVKYPLRLALNPFISGIGGVFPALVSGGAILSIVLSLPTIGPLQVQALMNADVTFAGSILMVLSVLGVLGTLVSDLLLLWLDPRIRLEGGSQ
jgi:ABC-type dipeptide/oligopeptide/nickel transport system permease component/ABC-type transport system substrate-binding protein